MLSIEVLINEVKPTISLSYTVHRKLSVSRHFEHGKKPMISHDGSAAGFVLSEVMVLMILGNTIQYIDNTMDCFLEVNTFSKFFTR